MNINKEEKRRFPRVAFKNSLRYQIRGTKEFSNVVTNDIGGGGVSFIDNRFVAPNTYVNIEINLLSRYINSIGKIVSVNSLPHSDQYRLGVEFLEIERNQKKCLNDFLEMRTEDL